MPPRVPVIIVSVIAITSGPGDTSIDKRDSQVIT